MNWEKFELVQMYYGGLEAGEIFNPDVWGTLRPELRLKIITEMRADSYESAYKKYLMIMGELRQNVDWLNK